MIIIILEIRDNIYSSLWLVLLMGIFGTGFEIRAKKMIFSSQNNGMEYTYTLYHSNWDMAEPSFTLSNDFSFKREWRQVIILIITVNLMCTGLLRACYILWLIEVMWYFF